jgi:lysophospholipase L1-like esterase
MTAGGTSLIAELAVTAALLVFGLAPQGTVPRLRQTLRDDGISRTEVERLERGYYESLLDRGRLASQGDAPFDAGPLTTAVKDVREFVLKPNLRATLRGRSWSTNALGMRDRSYSRMKPPGTFRIAFVGDSIGAGWGVDDGQGFEPRLERAIDARSRASGGPRVEILNFAVPGHAPGQRWEDFTRAGGWAMGPDVVLYEATPADAGWDERRLRALLARGIAVDVPVYRDAFRRAGAVASRDVNVHKRRLRPYRREILAGVYRTITDDCRARGVPSVWVLIPRVGRPADPEERAELRSLASQAGFSAVIDLSDAYEGCDAKALAIGPADFHPNVEGHARLAQRLEWAFEGIPALWGSGPCAGPGDRRVRQVRADASQPMGCVDADLTHPTTVPEPVPASVKEDALPAHGGPPQ